MNEPRARLLLRSLPRRALRVAGGSPPGAAGLVGVMVCVPHNRRTRLYSRRLLPPQHDPEPRTPNTPGPGLGRAG